MRFTNKLMVASAATLMVACASNTKLDDGSYRTIGQNAPKQVQNYAAEQANARLGETGYAEAAGPVPLPDFPGATETARLNTPETSRNNQIARYGHPRILDKIVKTARIHCQPMQFKVSTNENSFWGNGNGLLTQCTYRFPQHCGAYTFSILNYGGKEVLVFKPKDGTHYVIDTLKGTPRSQPGLWDQDDHIGTSTTNAGYFFEGDYNRPYQQDQFNPANLGWIIKASYQDEEKYGQLYHAAAMEITRCF